MVYSHIIILSIMRTSSIAGLIVIAAVALAASDEYNQDDVDAFRDWFQDLNVPKGKLKVGPSSIHRYGMIAKDNLEV